MSDFLMLDTWAGRQLIPVDIVGETRKRYRVRLRENVLLPNKRSTDRGKVVLVPKTAICSTPRVIIAREVAELDHNNSKKK